MRLSESRHLGSNPSPAADRICNQATLGQILSAAELKQQQTFEIILPNLIHKSKKRNLKKK